MKCINYLRFIGSQKCIRPQLGVDSLLPHRPAPRKPLSKLITKCLQLVMEHYRQYNSGITRRTSVNTFWIINNSMEVLTLIDKLNKNRKTKHFDTFDFSTLYTSIPHDILLESLNKLIIEAVRIRGATFISVSYDNVFWSNTRHRDYVNTPAEKLMEYIKFLVDNVYISVGNRIYKQTVGIPMGTDCAPMLANLFLFSYEYAYTKEMLKTDYGTALAMRHTVRYIDDLLTFNNPTFKDKTSDLYPPTLTLKKTTESPDHVSYLDLLIRRHTDRLTTSVYDKRDNFNFHIVKYPHMDSNIPSKPAYGVYISQLVRISRICDRYVDFTQRHVELTSRLQKHGYKYDKLCQAFKKIHKTAQHHNQQVYMTTLNKEFHCPLAHAQLNCQNLLTQGEGIADTGHMKLSRYSVLYVDSYRYPVLCVMLYVTFSLGCLINFVIHQLNGESWYHQRSLTHHT